jgi:hypothetical protein
MAFYAKVVVRFPGQGAIAVVRFEQSLGKFYAGGYTASFHLFNGQFLVLFNVFLPGQLALRAYTKAKHQRCKQKEILFHGHPRIKKTNAHNL